ncbi:hypothetical protein MCOR27_003608 [Pyricularia oryzae]|uniref:CFEM domain-containing protein n=3 Tax=Pyricularia TaxID=48558 RepID=A0ABQ8NTZ4_PYRGI|nr:uncharacterized protein MGG_06755 [Pyricularia oryzae 70-15]KAH8842380.1 hypothetical protein MCOR01_006288 [Pyricularia oryzae]KAI6302055.1 hypothetical protein MCOR33_002514 [Pyricularia grisea]EHA56857.1 hypothetical protein MGG_06755 [Pyricularia oryzae 70-15]KAH9435565.1 hypothetical protein MCOR02_004489 [Pyricularia oryzae]KAI6259578.1 hypothetical protein MCOR19_004119 [Pyricularia oryzae]
MRFIIVAFMAALATPLALAQNTSSSALAHQIPDCAKFCLASFADRSTCPMDDLACLCPNTALKEDITKCVTAQCSIKEALFTKNVTSVACEEEIRDKRLELNITAIILGSMAALFVILRMFSKVFVVGGSAGLDDWFIVATILLGVADTVLIVEGLTAYGLGRDIWTLTSEQITQFGLHMYVIQIMYIARLSLLKMSLLFFYLRIFPNPRIRQLLWGTVAFNTGYFVAFSVTAACLCRPIHFFWERWDGEHLDGICMDANAIGWANAAVSIALDLWMLALPLSQLGYLKLHWKKKVGVIIMFAVGTFVTVMSVLRLQSLVSFANSDNPTWDNWDVVRWSTIEVNVGVICACLPPLRVLLIRAFPQLSGSTSNYPSQMNQNYGAGKGSKGAIALNSKVQLTNGRSRTLGVESTVERGSTVIDDAEGAAGKGGIQCQVTYSVSYRERERDEESLVGTMHRDDFDDIPRRGSPGGATTPSTMRRSPSVAAVERTGRVDSPGPSRSLSRSRSHHRNFSRPNVAPLPTRSRSHCRSDSVSVLDSRERLDPDAVGPLSPRYPLP